MLRKVLIAVFSLLALAALALPVVLKALLPPERVRALVAEKAGKSLHREVRLGGASLSVLRGGIELDDLSISEAPDFKAGTFASVRSFTLSVKLLPLLSKRIVVDSVAADGLQVRVVKGRDGRYNFEDLAGGPAAAAPQAVPQAAPHAAPGASKAPPAAPAAPAAPSGAAAARARGGSSFEIGIHNLKLEDSRLSYEEEGGVRKVELSAVDAKVSGFSLSGPFGARLSGRAKGVWDATALDGSASFNGTVDLGGRDPAKLMVDAKSLEVSAAGWTAKVSGRAKDLRSPALDLAFTLSGPSGAAASGSFKGAVTLPSEQAALAAAGSLSLKTSALSAAQLSALGALPPGMPLPALSGSTDFSYSADALTLKTLELRTPWGPLKASGRVAGLSKPKSELDLAVDTDLSLPALRAADAPWLKLPKGATVPPLRVSGKARVRGDSLTTPGLTIKGAFGFLEAAGTVRKPVKTGTRPEADLTLSTKVQLPALKASDLPWATLPSSFELPPMEIVGEGRLKGDDLSLSPLRVKGRAGTLEASGTVRRLTSDEPEPDLDLTAKLSLPPLKSADDPFGKVPPGLSLPASSWDGSLTASRDEVKIRSLRAVIGRNDFSIDNGRVTGMRSGTPFVNLVVKCRQFQLEDLTALSQSLKEMQLKGGGYFALGATGRLPRPVLEGKAQFKGVGAVVGGLKLADFTGTASFNETRIDVPNLRGRLNDGDLALNLTARNYAKAPDLEVEASLTRFDLGAYLAAKQALEAKAAEREQAKDARAAEKAAAQGQPARAPAAAAQPAPPISTRGKLMVGELVHPNATARDIRLDWDITGVTPDMRRLNGTAKVASPSGHFSNLQAMGKQSKILKVLTFPLAILQKIALGAMRLDLNNPDYTAFTGDYAFSDGVMNIRDGSVNFSGAPVDLKGSVDLPNETLDLTVTAEVVRGAPVDVAVTGTLDSPKTKVKVGKLVGDQIKAGAEQLLKGILKR
jgi:AsmA protein